ncbi:hypothetical protein [Streptomyces sp. Amel2xC10]|uniref:hypothetical protein n=1 Tax=Streptomyces sp. Amel2xC10 TaxID=1305826 RepID=UPI000A091275|nr:hypothetical protein [Streptomyces sp. Amel2xC10]SMF15549.1 hypothetical protein SAMN02745830_01921 [Streptomyces sp. Amel2xC10]
MSATEHRAPETAPDPSRPYALPGVSMSALLASCEAARAVSTPPRTPDRTAPARPVAHPEAA